MKHDNIPETLNSPAQARADSHDQHAAVQTPAQPITLTPGADAGCEALRTTLPYLTGEAEEAARRQLSRFGR
jgi:hypothetical protein